MVLIHQRHGTFVALSCVQIEEHGVPTRPVHKLAARTQERWETVRMGTEVIDAGPGPASDGQGSSSAAPSGIPQQRAGILRVFRSRPAPRCRPRNPGGWPKRGLHRALGPCICLRPMGLVHLRARDRAARSAGAAASPRLV